MPVPGAKTGIVPAKIGVTLIIIKKVFFLDEEAVNLV